jgi:hypothetical protein
LNITDFIEWLTYLLMLVIIHLIVLISETDESIRVISVNDLISVIGYLL